MQCQLVAVADASWPPDSVERERRVPRRGRVVSCPRLWRNSWQLSIVSSGCGLWWAHSLAAPRQAARTLFRARASPPSSTSHMSRHGVTFTPTMGRSATEPLAAITLFYSWPASCDGVQYGDGEAGRASPFPDSSLLARLSFFPFLSESIVMGCRFVPILRAQVP